MKFDLAVKQVKVNTESSFEQSIMGPSLRCDIPSFVEIGQLVPIKKIFRVLTIYGLGGHLGHVAQIPHINFSCPYPWRLHTKFGF